METKKVYDLARVARIFGKIMGRLIFARIIFKAAALYPEKDKLSEREMKIIIYQSFQELSLIPINERALVRHHSVKLIGIFIEEHFESAQSALFFDLINRDHPGAEVLRSDLIEAAIASAFEKALSKEVKDEELREKIHKPSLRYERSRPVINTPERKRDYKNFVLDGITAREKMK